MAFSAKPSGAIALLRQINSRTALRLGNRRCPKSVGFELQGSIRKFDEFSGQGHVAGGKALLSGHHRNYRKDAWICNAEIASYSVVNKIPSASVTVI